MSVVDGSEPIFKRGFRAVCFFDNRECRKGKHRARERERERDRETRVRRVKVVRRPVIGSYRDLRRLRGTLRPMSMNVRKDNIFVCELS